MHLHSLNLHHVLIALPHETDILVSMSKLSAALCILFIFVWATPPACAESWNILRRTMITEIEANVRATSAFIGRNSLDERVLRKMAEVPRHEFVPSRWKTKAYQNRPLPIGYGQTISQPYMVAIMTDLLALNPKAKVLEVGTGSGYQAAILSRLVDEVHTLEIIPELAKSAKELLARLGYNNVAASEGDGYYGMESEAPFDAIMVTASASHIPPPLVRQLKPGGRMVIPVGGPWMVQHLILVTKDLDGKIQTQNLLPVRFVPLTGGH